MSRRERDPVLGSLSRCHIWGTSPSLFPCSLMVSVSSKDLPWPVFSTSEDDDKGAVGWLTGRSPPMMRAWDVAGGIHRSWIDLGKTTFWGGYTQDFDGLGG